MAVVLNKLWQGYQIVFEEWPDEKTKPWFLVSKPYQGITLLVIYLMFVFKWGPQWMKNRPPFNLDKILILYNALQIACCTYVFVQGIWQAWGWDYKWICEPVDHTVNEKSLRIATIVYYYFLLKVADLLDTVFFVLRKKFNQVTFLHVYHHTGMVILVWAAVTYQPGGHGTFVGVINTIVHVCMYTYYLLIVAKPELKQSLWWKKYITQLQILQFLILVIHMSIIVFRPDCEYPRWISGVFLPQNVFMLIMFIDFYIKAYIKKPKVRVPTNGSNGVSKNHKE